MKKLFTLFLYLIALLLVINILSVIKAQYIMASATKLCIDNVAATYLFSY